MNDNLSKIIQRESPLFPSIIETMIHSKKDDGRSFLCLYNNIIDEIISTSVDMSDSIKVKIIHMPHSPIWARELLLRFIIHKVALTFNKTTLDKLKQSIHRGPVILPSGVKESKRYLKAFSENNAYFKKIAANFAAYDIPENNIHSAIITKQQDFLTTKADKNIWLDRLYSDTIDQDVYNLSVLTNKSAFELETDINTIRRNSGSIPNIENFFILHSNNKSSITNSYNIKQLSRLNQYGLGIKNCIIFSFSDKPLKLFYTLDNIKNKLISNLLFNDTKRYNSFDGFITFSQEESDCLFNRETNQELYLIDDPELHLLVPDIDSVMEDIPNNYWHKNLLALAISQETQKLYLNKLPNQCSPYVSKLWGEYFYILRRLWNDRVKVKIEEFIADSTAVVFLVANDTPNEFKNAIRKQFALKGREVRFRSLKDLTSKKGVQGQKIIALQYRYTDLAYKSYPNSFDRLPLKPGQRALVVINKLTHYTYFKWGEYRYNKSNHELMYSDFRKKYMGWDNMTFEKPSVVDIKEFIDESEINEKNYHTEKCKVYYKDCRQKEYLACERVLFMHNGLIRITTLKDLSSEDNIKLQLLDELTEQVKLLITEKAKNNSVLEELIRKDQKYSLSDTEIRSDIELWKILLMRKVALLGEDEVYTQIFSTINDEDKVSKVSFYNWCDPNNTMMLPRSKKCQIALLRYVGFEPGSPYYKVIISKKLTSINKSRSLNSQINSLLQKILIVDVDDELCESMCNTHEDIFTLLDIETFHDLRSLKDLLDISWSDVTKIECEDNDTE